MRSTKDYPVVTPQAPAQSSGKLGGNVGANRMVFWLPPEEAALRFGVSVDELITATRSGELQVQAKVAGGQLLATLCSTELIERYGEPRRGRIEQPLGPGDQEELAALRSEVEHKGNSLREAEHKNVRMQAELDAADRVERSLQRYADRVDQRLDDVTVTYEAKLQSAEVLRLNMARTIGRMETEMLRLQDQVQDQAKAQLFLGEEAPKARPKRRWFFGRKA